MKITIVLLTILMLATVGCSNKRTEVFYKPDGTIIKTVETDASDYMSHTDARVSFKKLDSQRIAEQAAALRDIAITGLEGLTKLESALMRIVAADKITELQPQEYGEAAPKTTTEALVEVTKAGVTGATHGIITFGATSAIKAAVKEAGPETTSVTQELDDGSTATLELDQSVDISTEIDTDITRNRIRNEGSQ